MATPTAQCPSNPSIVQRGRPTVTKDFFGVWRLESYTNTIEGGEEKHPLGSNPRVSIRASARLTRLQ
jgi:hypothetical protein